MRFDDIYNPKNVYEGFFETYFIRPFIHHYADFQGKEALNSCLLSLLAWFIISLGITGIMLGQVGIIGPEGGIAAAWIICGLWFAVSLVPIAALLVRVSHGAPDKPHKIRILGIDTLLGVSCILFFILGLLMMITTFNSGELNPNARVYDEPDTGIYEENYVREEPIFTYQDASPAAEATADSLDYAEENDMESPDETFDPVLLPPDVDTI